MPKIYVGNSGNVARKSKAIYIGNSSNLAKRCKKIYVGDANNKARLAFCDLETPLVINLGWGDTVVFSYDGNSYGPYGPSAGAIPVVNLPSFRLKAEEETIRFTHTQVADSESSYYNFDIVGGETNELYIMPPHTLYWGDTETPETFSYTTESNNSGYVSNEFNRMDLHTQSIYSDSKYVGIKMPNSYSGRVIAEISGESTSAIQTVEIGNVGREVTYQNITSSRMYVSAAVNAGYIRIRYTVDPGYGQTIDDCRLRIYKIYVV